MKGQERHTDAETHRIAHICISKNAEMDLQIDEKIVSSKMMGCILWGCLFQRVEINCIPTDKIYLS